MLEMLGSPYLRLSISIGWNKMVNEISSSKDRSSKAATTEVVDVSNLAKRYTGWSILGRRPIDALRGVDLKARGGEVFGLLGPNGAGKTTLIKVLLGVVRPSSGTARLFGESAGSVQARRRVGYLPESLRIDRHHTARSALAYYGRLSGMSQGDIARRADELLELVGLKGRDRECVARFSKGMYQRLGLAQALLHDPDLLILDEPTDGLDPVGRNEVRKVLETLRDQGKTIFLNSHILQEVEVVCSRVAILAKGKIRGVGTVGELSQRLATNQVTFDLRSDTNLTSTEFLTDLSDSLQIDALNFKCQQSEAGLYRLSADLQNQLHVDQLVDVLRAKRISISQLEKKRPTLEDLFMQLVGEQEGSES